MLPRAAPRLPRAQDPQPPAHCKCAAGSKRWLDPLQRLRDRIDTVKESLLNDSARRELGPLVERFPDYSTGPTLHEHGEVRLQDPGGTPTLSPLLQCGWPMVAGAASVQCMPPQLRSFQIAGHLWEALLQVGWRADAPGGQVARAACAPAGWVRDLYHPLSVEGRSRENAEIFHLGSQCYEKIKAGPCPRRWRVKLVVAPPPANPAHAGFMAQLYHALTHYEHHCYCRAQKEAGGIAIPRTSSRVGPRCACLMAQ